MDWEEGGGRRRLPFKEGGIDLGWEGGNRGLSRFWGHAFFFNLQTRSEHRLVELEVNTCMSSHTHLFIIIPKFPHKTSTTEPLCVCKYHVAQQIILLH